METKKTTMRFDDETKRLMDALVFRLGGNQTTVMKQAIRVLARREGIQSPQEREMETQSEKRTWQYEEIAIDQLRATDLRAEVKEYTQEAQTFRITINNQAETADALYIPSVGRLGIAWGADATWADVDDVESGIEMYVNDGEEWNQRN